MNIQISLHIPRLITRHKTNPKSNFVLAGVCYLVDVYCELHKCLDADVALTHPFLLNHYIRPHKLTPSLHVLTGTGKSTSPIKSTKDAHLGLSSQLGPLLINHCNVCLMEGL
jgi:hypothetical protein